MCRSPRSLLQHAVLLCWLVLWFSDIGKVLKCLFGLKSTFCKLCFEFWLLVNTVMLLVNEKLRCSQLFIHSWSFSWLDMR